MVNKLIKLSDHLDRAGRHAEASYIDKIIEKMAKDETFVSKTESTVPAHGSSGQIPVTIDQLNTALSGLEANIKSWVKINYGG